MKQLNKQGKLNTATLNTAILGIVLLVVLLKLYAELVPEAQNAANNLTNASGSSGAGAIPLVGLFSSNGLIFIIIMAALIIVIVKAFMPGGK